MKLLSTRIIKACLAIAVMAVGLGVVGAGAAQADTRCSAVAFRANGARLGQTRTVEIRNSERRACRMALRGCERRLDRLRFRIARRLPFARCEVTRVRRVANRRYERPRRDGFACNYRACERAYRSFRPSDCTFQPYNGPRRLCTR